jgi:hypothetical protein
MPLARPSALKLLESARPAPLPHVITTAVTFNEQHRPWDKARQATVISEHATAAAAFVEIDRLSSEMVRMGAPSDAVDVLVFDGDGHQVGRPGVH